METDDQRRLLGRFIRSHRERIAPEGPLRRRRTPGLRREELAQRAGIGVTWCAWIEQGRPIAIAPATLGRLADALVLTAAERAYLFELAGRRDPQAPPSPLAHQAPEAISALVQALPHPAYGLDPLWNACCWNAAAAHLFGDWLGGEGCPQANLLRYTFTAASARALIPDWDNRARRLLAEFRADAARLRDDPRFTALVDDLRTQSPLFDEEWEAQSVLAREGGERLFDHPADGRLTYRQHTLNPAERRDYKLVVLVPVQAELPPGRPQPDERASRADGGRQHAPGNTG
ncbi:helix-turn-helix domain-containing protein [Altererythrobacter xixiisoli]|uniref:Helix-turn-helix domain-containing protein n=1 Tax=Croceibacterium xixiisoli TaxID=1476466 RepID=A0A6I4TR96_9SPHN|nr:helix-turn-helix transcriptional regulator [Croceibacterium xixiisoli]MXO98404.1 helix-turn-helix domain-containing protein [Croceibacterium xixiisoli]